MTEWQIPGKSQRFAHYRIGSLLGEGGFGRVHAAWDERLAREVAIKFASADQRRQDGLRYEAQRLASQRHRAFVSVFALEERPGELAMVMELVRGRTLAQTLKDLGALPMEQVLRFAVEAAAALAAAHRSGWAHGDLKPSNLMLTDDGWLRILDFGAAAALDALDSLSTASGDAMAGTLAYLAPERLLGARVSARSDIYSLGLVLYEALTRRGDPDDAPPWSELHRRLYGPERGRLLPAPFDAGLRALVERMTRRLAHARPASMAQVHAELVRVQSRQRQDGSAGRHRRVGSPVAVSEATRPVHAGERDPPTSVHVPVAKTVLRVSFDMEQRGAHLFWRAADGDGERDVFAATGRYAGAVHLREGDAVSVEVTGYGTDRLISTNLLDAVLFAMPLHGTGERLPPSPFSHTRATAPIDRWLPGEIRLHRDGKLKASVQRSLTPLQVVQQSGRWMLSLVLTVMIESATDDGRLNEIRVFSFNPETEVGPRIGPSRAPSRTMAHA